jgi:DNA helicase-2/ATP-dependent DNA helicase PcrA
MNMIASSPRGTPGYLDRLNEAQRRAVLHGDGQVAGPLLVIAGAGTGKTNTLAHRVAHVILGGADPRRMLLMTFSRRAAVEMRRRIERIAGEVLGEKAAALTAGLTWAGTFHAIGARILREHASAIGLDPTFTIHDRSDSADLMNLVRHRLGLTRTESRFPEKGTCLDIYSRAVNACEPLQAVLESCFPAWIGWAVELKGLFAAYVEAKQAAQVLDYDDLLLYWAEMLSDPAAAAALGSAFDHVFVDEYQDTNRLQAKILLALKPDGRGVTVVGDDAQAIYGFRAAEVRNILDFPGLFEPRARVVTLEQNYRSTEPILAAANAVIGEARERFTKELWSERRSDARPRLVATVDETAQADYVCREVLATRESGIPLKAQAVLFRTSHHCAQLELELTRRNIPFVKFGGLKFLEAAHVKDLLAVLRFADNPRDRVSGFRVLQLMPGIGPATAEDILTGLDTAAGAAAALAAVCAPRQSAEHWSAFVQLFELLRRGTAGWPAEIGAVRSWYEPHLERLYEDAAVRASDLAQLVRIADSSPSRTSFLTELTLDPPQATSDFAGAPLQDDDYLVLSTIHSAKGQEWRSVFVLNCVDGCIPSDLATGTSAEIEEERRLFYVAMTRAKDALHLMVPVRFYTHGQSARGDRHVHAIRTRFLPPHTLDRFEQPSWKPKDNGPATAPQPAPPRDLKASMRGMWT